MFDGAFDLLVADVGIDLSRIQAFMTEDRLQGSYVDAVLIHQRRRRMPQLVCGVLFGVETGLRDVFLDKPFDGGNADALMVSADEQSSFGLRDRKGFPYGDIPVQSVHTGVVQIDDAFLVAFAGDFQRSIRNISDVSRN